MTSVCPTCGAAQPPAAPVDPCPYAIDGCVLEKQEVGPCLCANPVQRSSAGSAEEMWKELLEKDDRTSPEEYPEMALITLNELKDFLYRWDEKQEHYASVRARHYARSAQPPALGECICQDQHRRGYCTEPGCPYSIHHTAPPQTVPLTPGKSDMLDLSKRIETGLKADDGGFFAPPLSRKQWWMIASSLDYAARFDVPQSAATGEEFLPRDAWSELVHKDDRTSPEEYPDMCLISFDELKDYMERHTPALSRPHGEPGK